MLKSRRLMLRSNAWVVVAASFVACVSPSFAGPKALSKEELLSGVTAAQSGISDLDVRFHYRVIKGPDDLVKDVGERTVVQGSRTYRDVTMATIQDGPAFRKVVSFDGRRSGIYLANQRLLTLGSHRTTETDTINSAFVLANVMASLRAGTEQLMDSENLGSILASKYTTARNAMQSMAGHWCCVVDVQGHKSGKVAMRIWIDSERGFAPLRKTLYKEDDDANTVLVDQVAEEVVQAMPGLWLVAKARRTVYPVLAKLQFSEQVMEVDGLKEGKPQLKVNAGIPKDFFAIWKAVPPGTMVTDKDTGLTFTAGGTDYSQLGEAIDESIRLSKVKVQVPERAEASKTELPLLTQELPFVPQESPASPQAASTALAGMRWPWLLVGLLVGVVVAGAVIVIAKRRRNNAHA